MNTFKKCQVVMLATKELTCLFMNSNKLFNYHKPQQGDSVSVINQHLYIISDDKIKIGDYYYNPCNLNCGNVLPLGKLIDICEYEHEAIACNSKNLSKVYKIIATTDNSLFLRNNKGKSLLGTDLNTYLPQPSKEFIEEYITSYNNGNLITDVNVEYIEYTKTIYNLGIECSFPIFQLKVNPSNKISITKVKDTYTKEEVKILLKSSFDGGYNLCCQHETNRPELNYNNFDEWLNKNF